MIKIVQGVYGFLDKSGIVRPKTEADEPFELLPEQEARLVALGVAEYVDEPEGEHEAGGADLQDVEVELDPIGFDETPPEEEPVDLATLTVNELREIGKEYGITFKANAKKAEMIKAIMEAQAEIAEDDESEPAPAFDATEAVQ